jgi:trimeric autotransporter adhesin
LVYLAGTFTGFRQGPENTLISRRFLAAVDTKNGKLTEWNPTIEGFQIEGFRPAVLAIADQSDVIFVGGEFNKVSGSNRTNLAAVDRKTGLATSWAANIQSYYGAGIFTVRTLALHANDLIVGGAFYNVAGQLRTNLAVIDVASGSVKPFNLAPIKPKNSPSDNNGSVKKIATHDNILYIAGTFTTVGDKPRAGLAAIDLQTETVTDWNPQANGEIRDFAFGPDGIYLGGVFTSLGSSNRVNLAMVDYATGKPLSWNPYPNGAVNALLFENGRLFAGGEFTQVGTNAVSYLAIFAEEGSFWFGDTNATATEFQAKLFGEEGKSYVIEASEDFGTWEEITRGQPVDGKISFSDPIGTSAKFYRSRLIE